MLGVGVWLRLSYAGYAQLLPKYSMISADSICIAVGVVVFVVAFFGCCGSWFQSRCMLITVSCPRGRLQLLVYASLLRRAQWLRH
jgi:tetraspanin-9